MLEKILLFVTESMTNSKGTNNKVTIALSFEYLALLFEYLALLFEYLA